MVSVCKGEQDSVELSGPTEAQAVSVLVGQKLGDLEEEEESNFSLKTLDDFKILKGQEVSPACWLWENQNYYVVVQASKGVWRDGDRDR